MKSISPFNQPRQTLVVVIACVSIIVIAGLLVGLNQAGFSIAGAANNFYQVMGRIGGADLVVTAEQTVLPADGKAQTIIHAQTVGTTATISASLIQGSGTITKQLTDKEAAVEFLYTAGSQLGTVKIVINSGALNQTIFIELVEAVTPATPQIVSPADGASLNEALPTITGTGPAVTRIVITNNGQTNTTGRTDDAGNFSIRLEKPLYNGNHTIAALAINDLKISSPLSNLITVKVTTEPAKLDAGNIRISPNPALAGGIFGVFVPASLSAGKVEVEFNQKTYELFDHNKSSVFTGPVAAPLEPGIYFGTIILTDVAGNATRFEQALRVPVKSS